MKFSSFYKGFLNLLLLSPLILANDCDDIKQYLNNNKLEDSIINECIVNEEGNVTTLKFENVNLSLTQKDINKLTSYKSIKVLEYKFGQLYNDIANITSEFKNEQETLSRDIGEYNYEETIEIPRTELPSFNLLELLNLTELSFINYSYGYYYESPYYRDVYIKNNGITQSATIILPDSIKKLSIDGAELSKTLVDAISKLTKLEELVLYDAPTDSVNLSSIKSKSIIVDSVFSSFDQLIGVKQLTVVNREIINDDIVGIGKLTNLEELYFQNCVDYSRYSLKYSLTQGWHEINRRNLDWSPLKNLSKLTIFESNENNFVINEGSIKNLKSLKKLSISDTNVFGSIIKEIGELINLEDLYINNIYYITGKGGNGEDITTLANVNTKYFENLRKLKKLTIINQKVRIISKEIGQLEALEYIDLSSNGITEIPETLNSLGHLKYLNLENNSDLSGKTLTNENLEVCNYGKGSSICKVKEMKCLKANDIQYELCSNSSTTPVPIEFENDCEEIKYLLKDKKYSNQLLSNCTVNDEGKVTVLKIKNQNSILTQEDIDKLTSYNSLNIFEYEFSQQYSFLETEDNDYEEYYGKEDVVYLGGAVNIQRIPHPETPSFNFDPTVELEEFTLKCYSKTYEDPGNPEESNYIYVNGVSDSTELNLPNSVKKLNIYYVDISQKLVDSLSNISQLEKVYFEQCELSSVNFKNINISSLTYNVNEDETLSKNSLTTFNTLKNLELQNVFLSQDNINEIGKLNQLEELVFNNCNNYNYTTYVYHDFDWSAFKNLSNLSVLEINNIKIKEGFLTSLKNLKKLSLIGVRSYSSIFNDINSLTQLEELTIGRIFDCNEENKCQSFEVNIISSITGLTNLKKLSLENTYMSSFPDEISKLTNLDTLILNSSFSYNVKTIPKTLGDMVNLKYLDLKDNDFTSLPDSFGKLINLQYLDLSNNKFKEVPEIIGNLENLEYLNFYDNYITTEVPEFLNNLNKLTYVNFALNFDMKGKSLTNEHLQYCNYHYTDICITKEMKCLEIENTNNNLELCTPIETTTTTSTTTTTTTDAATTTTTSKELTSTTTTKKTTTKKTTTKKTTTKKTTTKKTTTKKTTTKKTTTKKTTTKKTTTKKTTSTKKTTTKKTTTKRTTTKKTTTKRTTTKKTTTKRTTTKKTTTKRNTTKKITTKKYNH